MDFFIYAVILACYGLYRLISSLVRKLGLKKLYARAMDKLALEFKPGSFRQPPRLEGQVGDFFLHILHPYWKPSQNQYVVDVKPGNSKVFYFRFTLKPRKNNDQVGKEIYSPTVKTLDTFFDSLVEIEGHSSDEAHILSFFHREARSLITELITASYNGKFMIHRNSISTTVISPDLQEVSHKLLRLAEILKRPGETADYLQENFADPREHPPIRRRNLSLLLTTFPAYPARDQVIAAALEDPDPGIRFLGYLHTQEPRPDLTPIWEQASGELKERICQHLAGIPGATPFLIRVYPEVTPELQVEILAALKSLAEPEASDFLVVQLAEAPQRFKRSVIEALARCGTVSAVRPLYELKSPFLRPLAKNAITEIQSRLGPAEAGWLSLSGLESGSLSLNPAGESGTLSLEPGSEDS